jgi:hypothetical protein
VTLFWTPVQGNITEESNFGEWPAGDALLCAAASQRKSERDAASANEPRLSWRLTKSASEASRGIRVVRVGSVWPRRIRAALTLRTSPLLLASNEGCLDTRSKDMLGRLRGHCGSHKLATTVSDH